MDIQIVIDNFHKQWEWIYNETLKRKRKVTKEEYFKEHNKNIPFHECYLCEYIANSSAPGCKFYPIKWPGFVNNCCDLIKYNDSLNLYVRWENINDYYKAAKLAKKILNRPIKKRYRKFVH